MRKLSIFIFGAVLATCVFLYSCASTPKQGNFQQLLAEGRFEEAQALFDAKTDVNAIDGNGNTALHLSAKANADKMCSFLIFKGADTEIRNFDGDTPLLVAIRNDSLAAAKVLAMVHGDIFVKEKLPPKVIEVSAAPKTKEPKEKEVKSKKSKKNEVVVEEESDEEESESEDEGEEVEEEEIVEEVVEKTALELALAKGERWYDAMITPLAGEIRSTEGETIVHYFVRKKDELGIDYCIRRELPLSIKDNEGVTPVALAFESVNDAASVRIAAELLKANAEPARGEFAYFEDAVKSRNTILRFHDGQTPLHIATISGHTGVVDYLIAERTTSRVQDVLSAQDISGNTPLHEAVRYGHVSIAKTLLSCGANVNAMDALGKTPVLIIIPKEAQKDMYALLLKNGANIKQKDMFGDTVFHVVSMGNADVSILKALYKGGASVNERNKQGVTPLAVAVDNKNEAHIAFYASCGADIHAEDQNKETPLTLALKEKSLSLIQTLITPQNAISFDSAGNSPLHIAILNNASVDIVKFIIDSHADINAQNRDGNTPLMLALKKNRRDLGELLLDYNADIFIANTNSDSPLRVALLDPSVQDWLITSKTLNDTDGSGNTPLHFAAELGIDSSVKTLIEKGAKINAQNANGENPIFSAIKSDSPSVIKILFEAGCAIDANNVLARDNLGNTAAHACVRWNALNSLKTVRDLGCQLDAQNISGKSALSDACRAGKRDIAMQLLNLGADVNSTDSTGKTALWDAIDNNDEKLVSMLLARGANPQIQEMYGRNAYHEAALSGNIEIIQAVRKAGGNPLSRDVKGDSPFSLVVNSNNQIINAVLGTNKTVVDSDGNTPIHICIEKNAPSNVLKTLLAQKYPANQRNGKGKTPLALAVEKGNKAQSKILLDAGADPFLASNSGESALTIALKNVVLGKNKEILELIAKQDGGVRRDMQGDGILHYAARIADVPTAEFLLNCGLDKTIKNISGETPADVARRWGKDDVLRILQ